MRPRVTVNADDFGCAPHIDEGILECFRRGGIKSTSLLVTFPDRLEESAALLRAHPDLAPGLHLDLTWGPAAWPESSPFFSPRGCPIKTAGNLLKHLALGKISRNELRAAVRGQFERFLATGLPLTHVDTHQHVLCLPGIFPAVAECCREHSVTRLRIPRESRHGAADGGWKRYAMAAFALGRRFGRPFGVVGTVNSGRWTESDLSGILKGLPENSVTEIIVHPGNSTERSALPDKLSALRQNELTAVTSPRVLEALGNLDFIPFSQV